MRINDIHTIDYPCVTKGKTSELSVEYVSAADVGAVLNNTATLAVVGFGEQTCRGEDQRQFFLGMPELSKNNYVEVWRTSDPVQTLEQDGLVLSYSSNYLFGSMILDDQVASDFIFVAEEAYTRLVNITRATGFPHLLRMWNYFSRINDDSHGLERYQQFCLGRHNALEKMQMHESLLPAASALGTHAPGLAIYFIAAREMGMQIENPQQVSAFKYPQQYAPRSPSFSRAMVKQCRNRACLYISGTASITGHETRHAGDIRKQLDETLNNIEILLTTGRQEQQLELNSISDLTLLKVYLRRAEDEALITTVLQERFGDLPFVILHADICRENLLIEIEGVYLG